jgi:hypothetical protein
MKIQVTNIRWDVPKALADRLPKTLILELPSDTPDEVIDDLVADEVSSEVGFCHDGCEYEIL